MLPFFLSSAQLCCLSVAAAKAGFLCSNLFLSPVVLRTKFLSDSIISLNAHYFVRTTRLR